MGTGDDGAEDGDGLLEEGVWSVVALGGEVVEGAAEVADGPAAEVVEVAEGRNAGRSRDLSSTRRW